MEDSCTHAAADMIVLKPTPLVIYRKPQSSKWRTLNNSVIINTIISQKIETAIRATTNVKFLNF